MSRQTSKPIDAWAVLLDKELKASERLPEGKGWRTAEELRTEYKIGQRKLYSLINKLMGEKRLEKFSGYIFNESGSRSSKVWYRIKT